MMTQMGSVNGGTSTINSERVQLQACKTKKKQQKNAKLNGKRIATKSAFSLTILLLFTTPPHTHTYIHTYTHTHTHTQTHTYTHTHTNTYIHIYICVCVYTYIYIYTAFGYKLQA